MNRADIITAIAKQRQVETIIANIAHRDIGGTLEDLSQMVYEALLTTDEDKLQDLWENSEMHFYIARIVMNQYFSANSPYYRQMRKFSALSVELGTVKNKADE